MRVLYQVGGGVIPIVPAERRCGGRQRIGRRWQRQAHPSECRQRGGTHSSVGRHGRPT
jgi:hypothetical protein